MDSRKVSLFATIAVIALVAVGIGFAYTAITVNQDNSVSTQYVALIQHDSNGTTTGAYQFSDSTTDKIAWNTKDYKVKAGDPYIGGDIVAGDIITVFSLPTDNVITFETVNYYTAKVGSTFELRAQSDGANAVNATCSISEAGFANNATYGTTFFIKIYEKDGDATDADKTGDLIDTYKLDTSTGLFKNISGNNTFTFEAGTGTAFKTYLVKVYYGYEEMTGKNGIAVEHNEGEFPTSGIPTEIQTPITSARLGFTLSDGSAVVTSVEISDEGTPSIEHFSLVLTATVKNAAGSEMTYEKVVWSSSNSAKLAVDANTGALTIGTGGNVPTVGDKVIITATSIANDAVLATYEVTFVA